MRLTDINDILLAKLPQLTNLFSTDVKTCSISINEPSVVSVNCVAHGLNIGSKFTLSGFDIETDMPKIDGDIINNTQAVDTIIDADNFTFKIIQTFVTGVSSGGKLHIKVRSAITLNPELATNSYTKINLLTAFILDLGSNSSKDRGATGDMSFRQNRNTDFKIDIMNRFAILVYFPFTDRIGYQISTQKYLLLEYLINSLCGISLNTNYCNAKSQGISFISSQTELTTNAFLVQNYSFEAVETINQQDINTDLKGFEVQDIDMLDIETANDKLEMFHVELS